MQINPICAQGYGAPKHTELRQIGGSGAAVVTLAGVRPDVDLSA